MRKRIFRSFAILIVVAIVLTFAAMEYVSYRDAYANMRAWAKEDANLLGEIICEYGEEALNSETAGTIEGRVTLIASDGTVLFESDEDSASMQNHLERPEVQAALSNGTGEATRLSATFGQQTYYYALRLDDGSVIRISRTMDTVMSEVFSRIAIALGLIVLLFLIEIFLARSVTNRIVSPVNDLDLEKPLENNEPVYEELEPLLHRIDDQNTQIRAQVEQLKKEQEQYLAITENMQDALIVTDTQKVLSINKSAQKLFDVTPAECIGHDLITVNRDRELKDAFTEALAGRYCEKTIEKQGRTFRLHAAPVINPDTSEVYGTVLLSMDVTEKAQAETLRKEFTANVSHELKTPLMSISGYAELIENGLAKPEDITEFASRIHAEAMRLKNLVDDIIQLSKLDEAGDAIHMEEVNLYDVCSDVVKSLSPVAGSKNIKFEFEGEDAKVMGSRQALFEMVYNLCDNAIKYNNDGGEAKLALTLEDGSPVVTVSDTGIGISREHQDRIFERFYRVDKSHSRATGGTGLGLSIVKHTAALHDAQINLESTPGRGTTITVKFPPFTTI